MFSSSWTSVLQSLSAQTALAGGCSRERTSLAKLRTSLRFVRLIVAKFRHAVVKFVTKILPVDFGEDAGQEVAVLGSQMSSFRQNLEKFESGVDLFSLSLPHDVFAHKRELVELLRGQVVRNVQQDGVKV